MRGLQTYLLKKGFERGGVDRTLFIYRSKTKLLVAQNYIDDIVFGATSSDFAFNFCWGNEKRVQNEHGRWTQFLPRIVD